MTGPESGLFKRYIDGGSGIESPYRRGIGEPFQISNISDRDGCRRTAGDRGCGEGVDLTKDKRCPGITLARQINADPGFRGRNEQSGVAGADIVTTKTGDQLLTHAAPPGHICGDRKRYGFRYFADRGGFTHDITEIDI